MRRIKYFLASLLMVISPIFGVISAWADENGNIDVVFDVPVTKTVDITKLNEEQTVVVEFSTISPLSTLFINANYTNTYNWYSSNFHQTKIGKDSSVVDTNKYDYTAELNLKLDESALSGNYSETMTLAACDNTYSADVAFTAFDADHCKRTSVNILINNKVGILPTLVTSEFTYDGNEHEVEFSDYNTDAIALSGDLQATNAGDYTVTASLKDKSSFVWSDGTTDDKTIAWKIKKAKLNPTLTFENKVYDGQPIAAPVLEGNVENGDVIIKYGKTKDSISTQRPTEAGTYVYTLRIAETANYEKYFNDKGTFEIKKATLNPTLTVKDKVYDGQPIDDPILEGNIENGAVIIKYGKDHDSLTTEKPTEAGTYMYTLRIAETANYAKYFSDKGRVTISPKQISFVPTQTTFTYDGDLKEVLFTTQLNNLATVSGNKATNAGDYQYTLNLTDKKNYTWEDGTIADRKGDWRINKAEITPEVIIKDKTYDGKPANVEIKNNPGDGKVTIEYFVDGKWTTEAPVDSSKYEISYANKIDTPYKYRFTVAETDNYKGYVSDESRSFSIIQDRIIHHSVKPTLASWTYGETPNSLSIANIPETYDGKISMTYYYAEGYNQFAWDSMTSPYAPKVAKVLDAGDYKLHLFFGGTRNYAGMSYEFVRFSVYKAEITPEVIIKDKLYDGKPADVTVKGNTGNGEVTIEYLVDGVWTTEAPVNSSKWSVYPKSVDEPYQYRFKVAETTNYKGYESTENGKFSIIQDRIMDHVKASDIVVENYTYGQKPGNITIATLPDDYTGSYSVIYYISPEIKSDYYNYSFGSQSFKGKGPHQLKQLEAGDYKLGVNFSGDRNYVALGTSSYLTVYQAELTTEAVETEFTYNGEEKAVVFSPVVDPKFITSTGDKATNAGNYTYSLSLVDTKNYKWAEGTKTSGDWKINKATRTPVITIADKVYDGDPIEAIVEGNAENGKVNIKYTDEKGNVVENPTNAGKYNYALYIGETANYKPFYTTGKFEIFKATRTPVITVEGKVYDGEPIADPTIEGNAEDGKVSIKYGLDWDSLSEEKPVNAGKYIYRVYLGETANYKPYFVQDTAEITKADLLVKVSVAEGIVEGDEYEPLIEGLPEDYAGEVEVTYFDKDGKEIEKPTAAGKYNVAVAAADDDNYNGAEAAAKFIIAKKPVKAPETGVSTMDTNASELDTYFAGLMLALLAGAALIVKKRI